MSPPPPTAAAAVAAVVAAASSSCSARNDNHGASPLAAFIARVCHTLWHGASALLTINPDLANTAAGGPASPRELYQATPPAFIHLVHRTLHPHHSPHIAATTLLYIQRYIASLHTPGAPPITPAPGSEARIWCTALQVTVKQHDDRAAASRLWVGSRIEELAGGGLSVWEMVAMEREFLRAIAWRLAVAEDEYKGWVQRLARFKSVMEAPLAPPKIHLDTSPPIVDDTALAQHLHIRRGSAQSMASTAELTTDLSDDDDFEDDDEDEVHDPKDDDYIPPSNRKKSLPAQPSRRWLGIPQSSH